MPYEYCTHCGSDNPTGDQTCSHCGQDISLPFSPYAYGGTRTFAFYPPWRFRRPFVKAPKPPIPQCPSCHHPVRDEFDDYDPRRNAPWNRKWNGSCKHCGHPFELKLHTPIHFDAHRDVQIRPDCREVQTFTDESVFLSGVTITTKTKSNRAEEEVESVFLSTGELVQFLRQLQGHLSVLLEQVDWGEDYT